MKNISPLYNRARTRVKNLHVSKKIINFAPIFGLNESI